MQTTHKIESSSIAHGEVYSTQSYLYVIKFVREKLSNHS